MYTPESSISCTIATVDKNHISLFRPISLVPLVYSITSICQGHNTTQGNCTSFTFRVLSWFVSFWFTHILQGYFTGTNDLPPMHQFIWKKIPSKSIICINYKTMHPKNKWWFNSSPLGQNCIFFSRQYFQMDFCEWISFLFWFRTLLKSVHKGPINYNEALVQVLTWH